MIVWLASYPKSGNTWVRSFLYSLIFSENGEVNLEDMQKLPQYPLRSNFSVLADNLEYLNVLLQNFILF